MLRSITPKRANSLARDPEIAAVLDTGNRSESNAGSGGEGEVAGGEVNAHLGRVDKSWAGCGDEATARGS